MITKIDMSSLFATISCIGMRQLVDGIAELPCLRSLNLSNNKMNDEYEKEILPIFDLKKIID
jgi:Leucine-rich repeat (LRR) protein